MQYSTIVFDTAPTGHTLRFLSFPSILEKALAKLSGLSGRFGPMMNQMSSMMGMGGSINIDETFQVNHCCFSGYALPAPTSGLT